MNPENNDLSSATLHFLSQTSNTTAALASCTKAGVPHVAVMYFYADEHLNFYFLTAQDTQKYANLTVNPHVSAVGLGPVYTTVQAYGEVVVLEKASAEENFAIANIKKRLVENGHTWPIFQLADYDDNQIAVFKFTPSSLYFLNLEKDTRLPVTTEELQKVI